MACLFLGDPEVVLKGGDYHLFSHMNMKEICKVSWSSLGNPRVELGLPKAGRRLLTFSTALVALDPVWWEIMNLSPRYKAGSELTYCGLTGISVKSIQCQNGNWFTPSEFEMMGGYGKSKNWKLSLGCHNWPLKLLIQVLQMRRGRSVLQIK